MWDLDSGKHPLVFDCFAITFHISEMKINWLHPDLGFSPRHFSIQRQIRNLNDQRLHLTSFRPKGCELADDPNVFCWSSITSTEIKIFLSTYLIISISFIHIKRTFQHISLAKPQHCHLGYFRLPSPSRALPQLRLKSLTSMRMPYLAIAITCLRDWKRVGINIKNPVDARRTNPEVEANFKQKNFKFVVIYRL